MGTADVIGRAPVLLLSVGVSLLLLPGCKRQQSAVPAGAATAPAPAPAQVAEAHAPEDVLPATPAGIQALLQSGEPVLSPAQARQALDYLRKPAPAASGEEAAAEYFNLVIAVLLAQPAAVKDFPGTLMATAADEQIPVILRDYALQHFYHAWSRETNPELKGRLEAQLKAEAGNPLSPLQGTALLTSCRIFESARPMTGPAGEKLRPLGGKQRKQTPPGHTIAYNLEEFGALALAAAVDPSGKPTARASAFHALQRLGIRSATGPARSVAGDPQAPEVVRCAALSVIGNFGSTESDRGLLEGIPSSPPLVKAAADHALARLSPRP